LLSNARLSGPQTSVTECNFACTSLLAGSAGHASMCAKGLRSLTFHPDQSYFMPGWNTVGFHEKISTRMLVQMPIQYLLSEEEDLSEPCCVMALSIDFFFLTVYGLNRMMITTRPTWIVKQKLASLLLLGHHLHNTPMPCTHSQVHKEWGFWCDLHVSGAWPKKWFCIVSKRDFALMSQNPKGCDRHSVWYDGWCCHVRLMRVGSNYHQTKMDRYLCTYHCKRIASSATSYVKAESQNGDSHKKN
jgi:hypothetical protein